jgi:hypothetical protein
VLNASSRAALDRLEEITRPTDSRETLDQLQDRITRRTNEMWEHLRTGREIETPAEAYRRLRLDTLQAERDEVLRIRSQGKIDHDVIDKVLYSLDVEESMLTVMEDQSEMVSNSDFARRRMWSSRLDPAAVRTASAKAPGPSICGSASAAATSAAATPHPAGIPAGIGNRPVIR